jgi:hypothetical protein
MNNQQCQDLLISYNKTGVQTVGSGLMIDLSRPSAVYECCKGYVIRIKDTAACCGDKRCKCYEE